mmetsp:Transcript_32930/g.60251  ORF Transcript_32930/g.60251 Transcript_32930/m.60251 type:complete len:205 (-) Transcript_32930:1451-2065(-)
MTAMLVATSPGNNNTASFCVGSASTCCIFSALSVWRSLQTTTLLKLPPSRGHSDFKGQSKRWYMAINDSLRQRKAFVSRSGSKTRCSSARHPHQAQRVSFKSMFKVTTSSMVKTSHAHLVQRSRLVPKASSPNPQHGRCTSFIDRLVHLLRTSRTQSHASYCCTHWALTALARSSKCTCMDCPAVSAAWWVTGSVAPPASTAST